MPELTQYKWVQNKHLNIFNDLFGGYLLSWVDEDTMMLASNNAIPQAMFVTRGMERVSFIRPARQGDRLCFSHKIVHIGKTSLWVWSEVYNQDGDKIFHSYTCLVSVDMYGNPALIDDFINANIRDEVPQDEHWNTVEFLKGLQGP